MSVLHVEAPTKITTTVSSGEVQVTLTQAEAVFLHSLMDKVGGEPSNTPRRYADSIRQGLREAGVPAIHGVFNDSIYATQQLSKFDAQVANP